MPTQSSGGRGSARSSAGRAAAHVVAAHEATRAPVVLVCGAEGLLADRAVAAVLASARQEDPATEVTYLDAAGYQPGLVALATSPSLFGGGRVVVVDSVEQTNDVFAAEAAAYLRDPSPDACLVMRHGGGQRAKGLLDAARAAGALEVACQPLVRDDEKLDFASAEFARAGRAIAPAALRALVAAVGSDLRELAAACGQLISDTDSSAGDRIEPDVVERYFGGRVEVTGFRVADAAVAGRAADALGLLRHALATGADPVPLVAALAAKVRALAKVRAAGRGRPADLARELAMPPWQVERALRELRGWDDDGLAAAVLALAEADTAVKGGGRDPVYAVERAVLTVAQSRGT